MRWSQSFLITLREHPREAAIASHSLMIRSNMIYQTAQGIYSWLPMGTRVLKKIENIVREEQNNADAQEVILPTIQPRDLWIESGRENAMDKETLWMRDRHDKEYLYAPTAEEAVTDVFRNHIRSYRNLPQRLYQIQWKFRDEIRPRFGVMRGREFLMKDCYSFDLSAEKALESYEIMFQTYIQTFARMGLVALPVQADTGLIGGDLSHEFHVLATTGESIIYYDSVLDEIRAKGENLSVQRLRSIYTAADDMHNPLTCPVPEDQLRSRRGIEVGQVFYLGTKYSKTLNAVVTQPDGHTNHVHMGCYGIGISRLVGAIIEANHDEDGIIWPRSVAPFEVGISNLRMNDPACCTLAEKVYRMLLLAGVDSLYDDRDEQASIKLKDMDLIGLPWRIVISPKHGANQQVEVKNRRTGDIQIVPIDNIIVYLQEESLKENGKNG